MNGRLFSFPLPSAPPESNPQAEAALYQKQIKHGILPHVSGGKFNLFVFDT